jgi:hypothetical protein
LISPDQQFTQHGDHTELDWLDVYLQIKRTIEEQLEEPETKQLMEDINAKVFGSTNVLKATRRESPSTVPIDDEVAEMKRCIARRKELVANGGSVSGVPAGELISSNVDLTNTVSRTAASRQGPRG